MVQRTIKDRKIDVSSEDPSSGASSALLTPDEGPSLQTSIFPFIIVSGRQRTFTFRVSLKHYLHWQR